MSKLYAGAARRPVTPPQELFTRIIAENERYSYKSIKEDVFVRAIAMRGGNERAVIVVTDLSVFPLCDSFADMLYNKLGIPPINCIIGGTRAHNGFSMGTAESELSPAMREYARFVHSRALDAVQAAFAGAVPARIGGVLGESRINACRDFVTPVGTIEAPSRVLGRKAFHLPVICFEEADGHTIALFINYAMQSACLSWNQFNDTYNYFCADFTGAVTSWLEHAGGESYPVLWSCGAGDDQHSTFDALVEYCDCDSAGNFSFVREVLPAEATLMLIRRAASEQGIDALRALKSINNYCDEFNIFSAETYRTVPSRKPYRHKLGDRKLPGASTVPEDGEKPLTLRLRLTVINGFAFLGVNADLYSSYYQKAAEILGCRLLSVLDASFGNIGSLPDSANESENIYGVGAWGSRCRSSREAEEIFFDALSELAESYKKHLGIYSDP